MKFRFFSSKFRSGFVLFIISFIVSLTVAEILLHLLLPVPQHFVFSGNTQKNELEKGQLKTDYHKFHTSGGFRLPPNLNGTIKNHQISKKNVPFRTNSLGFRNPEIKEKQKKRVLFLGDSITIADYVKEEETFVRKVQILSEKENNSIETINLGIGGTALGNHLAIFERVGLLLKPDVVILGFYLNDFRESTGVKYFHLKGILGKSRLVQYFFRTLSIFLIHFYHDEDLIQYMEQFGHDRFDLSTWDQWILETQQKFPSQPKKNPKKYKEGFNHLILKNFADWGSAWNNSLWDFMTPHFERLYHLSKVHNIQFLIVCFPVRIQVEADFLYNDPQKKLAILTKKLNIPLLDFLPIFRQDFKEKTEEIFYDHCHHTPKGQEIIAQNILQFLKENLD